MLTDVKNNLIMNNMSFAEAIAFKRMKNISKKVSLEEIKSAAYYGLVQAANKFEDDRGNAFTTYAYIIINNSIIDYLRELGWGKRNRFDKKVMSIDIENNDVSFKDILFDKKYIFCEDVFEQVFKSFPQRDKEILELYFRDDLDMKEIANKYSLSKGRISQVISECKKQIKRKWSKNEFYSEIAA